MNLKKVKDLVRKIKVGLYRGDRYHCPFCGYRSSRLGRFGFNLSVIKEKQIIGSGLRRCRCYQCNSTDRERLVFAYLEYESKFFLRHSNAKILHVSPEKHLTKYIRKHLLGDYIMGDLFTEGYSYPEEVVNMDITRIPYPDSHFDLIICNHVLEHIPNDHQAIKELHRVLKPFGKAILQVPISNKFRETYENELVVNPKDREREFGQYDHVRIYGQDYSTRLKAGGFVVEKLNLASKYPKLGLNPAETLFIGTKP